MNKTLYGNSSIGKGMLWCASPVAEVAKNEDISKEIEEIMNEIKKMKRKKNETIPNISQRLTAPKTERKEILERAMKMISR